MNPLQKQININKDFNDMNEVCEEKINGNINNRKYT